MRLLPIFLCLLWLSPVVNADTQVNVVGLFNGKAMLSINGGKPRTYAAGQVTPEGVKLVSADSDKAVLMVEGKRRELGMGQGISIGSGGGAVSGEQTATLYANNAGHFIGEGYINGSPIRFLVDTGATSVAMSGVEARRLGIDYLNGDAGYAHTAAGTVKAYGVRLNTVKIGGIVMNGVQASVVEGDAPAIVLLGMSVLNRVQMQRDGMVMTLTKKY